MRRESRLTTVDQRQITLIPLAMTIPNTKGVYSLSQYSPRLLVSIQEWHTYNPIQIKVGTPENWREMTAYGKGSSCWYLAMKAR